MLNFYLKGVLQSMKNLILLLGFSLIMSMVMVKASVIYKWRQLQIVPRPRQSMGYLSQPIAH